MRYLLDTHAFLWVLFDAELLSQNARKIIQNSENEILISMITYWEISLKYALGKLHLEGITPEELLIQAKNLNIDTLNLTDEVVASFHRLPRSTHKDPFDRLIVWQSIKLNIPLISKDRKLTEYMSYGLNIIW